MRSIALMLCCMAAPASAELSLKFQGEVTTTLETIKPFDSYQMPIGSALVRPIKTVVAEGQLTQKVWMIKAQGSSTLRVMDDLRQQLEAQGFEVLYECETSGCGGFDFRFSTRVAPEPVMHVDLSDFRYLAIQRLGQSVPEYVSLLVSRSADRGHVQMIHVGPSETQIDARSTETLNTGNSEQFLTSDLIENGHAVMSDLVFPRGSSELGEGNFRSLEALARFLQDNPQRRVVLVGHTDAEGSLSGNINLSRARATSVADRLVEKFGVNSDQVTADGVGFLSPRATNSTQEGRSKNRRVEAVLTSTQ